MSTMGTLYRQITFDGASSVEDRTISFGSLTMNPRNEISVSVIDAAGDSVTGTVAGMITFNITPPDSDRVEESANPLDLSTDARTFTPFFRSVRAAEFSVTGLGANLRVVVTFYKLPS